MEKFASGVNETQTGFIVLCFGLVWCIWCEPGVRGQEGKVQSPPFTRWDDIPQLICLYCTVDPVHGLPLNQSETKTTDLTNGKHCFTVCGSEVTAWLC